MLETECYQVLRISEQATFEEIKRAYRRSVQLYHPDVRRWDKNSGERFKKIASAYKLLSEKKRDAKPASASNTIRNLLKFKRTPIFSPAQPRPPEADQSCPVSQLPSSELVLRFIGTENIFVKREVVKALRFKKDKEALQLLARVLKTKDSEVRRLAIMSLVNFPGPKVVYLLASLIEDTDIRVRYEAIDALGARGGPQAERILKRLLRAKSFFIRERAKTALANFRGQIFHEQTG